MNEAEFSERIDALFTRVEEALDAPAAESLDCDYDSQDSVFTIEVADCAPVILNRHAPTQQLWLAAKSGGYHLAYDENDAQWRCTKTAKSFDELWAEITRAQFGQQIALPAER